MIEKPIGYQFSTTIIPVIETISQEADFKPTTAVIRRNNEIISIAYNIADWDNGYVLTFDSEEAENDTFSCEVPVTVDTFERIYRENWLIVGQSYEQIVQNTPVLVNLLTVDINGNLISGVYLYVVDNNTNEIVATGTSDQNGIFPVMLVPGSYRRIIYYDFDYFEKTVYFNVTIEL